MSYPQYDRDKKEWEDVQPLVKEAQDLKIETSNDDPWLDDLIPKHYLEVQPKDVYGTYITHNKHNFTQFTKCDVWTMLCQLLEICNTSPTEPVTEENGSVKYWCDVLQYRKPAFSVPIAKLMKLLVAQDFSKELIILSFKVFDQVWFKEFTVAKEIEEQYAEHFA